MGDRYVWYKCRIWKFDRDLGDDECLLMSLLDASAGTVASVGKIKEVSDETVRAINYFREKCGYRF